MKKHAFFIFHPFYKCLLMLVKKTKFGNNLPKLMLVELPEPSATCVRGMSCHFSTMGTEYGTLRSRLGMDKTRELSFLFKQLNK